MPFSARVVEPINKLDPHWFRFSSASEHPGVRVRKIFVIKKVQRLQATTAAGKKIQRILIFDDHPDSLRLILGGSASRDTRRTSGGWATLRVFILPGIAALTALLAMFWPLL